MAKLDLIPDLQVMIIQGALFGVAAALVKTQFVNPYLKLRDKRTSLTEGHKQSAEHILKICDEKTGQIHDRIKRALQQALEKKLSSKEAATLQQKAIVSGAEAYARAEIMRVESEIRSELERELQRQPAAVAKLTIELYTTAIS